MLENNNDKYGVANCKYYVKHNGVRLDRAYQAVDLCYKESYDYCYSKPFCQHKIIARIRNIFNKQGL